MTIPTEAVGPRFQQVVFPGTVMALALHPHVKAWLGGPLESTYGIGATVLLVAEILLLGIALGAWGRRLIYIAEGFALPILARPARSFHQWRVGKWQRKLRELMAVPKEHRSAEQQLEASLLTEKLSDFPIRTPGDGANVELDRPTRLGNASPTSSASRPTRWAGNGAGWASRRFAPRALGSHTRSPCSAPRPTRSSPPASAAV